MDLDDFRSILDTAGVDVWAFIDTAILVASLDYGQELKNRRDNIVERLYATSMVTKCRNCDSGSGAGEENRVNGNETRDNMIDEDEKEQENQREKPVNVDDEDEEDFDPFAGLFDDEQTKILEIKDQLEDPDLSEESLVELLQNLADMDINFKALQETDIGRHVNRVRKHPSNNVRRLSKQLVRKWKETVDEWVKLNQPGDLQQSTLLDGDSPDQKIPQNGHLQQVPDFGYSPNPHYGSSSSDKNNYEPERKSRPAPPPPRKEMNSPAKPFRPSPAPQRMQKEREPRERKDGDFDLEAATKRLQQNYRQTENAKKQRTIQVMDIHEIPKPKKGFFPKKAGGGGGGSSHGRHW